MFVSPGCAHCAKNQLICKPDHINISLLPTEEDAQALSDLDPAETEDLASDNNSNRDHRRPSRGRPKSKTPGSSSTSKSSQSYRKRSSRDSSSDSEATRQGLSTKLHENRQRLRLQNKENMAPNDSRSQKRKQSRIEDESDNGSDVSEPDYEAMNSEILKLRAEKARLSTRLSMEGKGTNNDNRSEAEKAMARLVAKRAKQQLFKKCKFIKNDQKLIKATRCDIIWFCVF